MASAAELPSDWWTTEHVAQYLEIRPNTVRNYVARGFMPQPDRRYGRTVLWKPRTITKWHAGRPRKGTDKPD